MKKLVFIIIALMLIQVSSVLAQEDDELEVFGLEAEKLLIFGSGLLASVLCAFTFVAYKRTKNYRLKFVVFAFFLFALKSFLISAELFIDELPWIDPISAILDFGILASFFFGVIKK